MRPIVSPQRSFDPASASVPFVATLVDVSSLVSHCHLVQVILQGSQC
jgi:Mg/Co/Ni transporter MgtE